MLKIRIDDLESPDEAKLKAKNFIDYVIQVLALSKFGALPYKVSADPEKDYDFLPGNIPEGLVLEFSYGDWLSIEVLDPTIYLLVLEHLKSERMQQMLKSFGLNRIQIVTKKYQQGSKSESFELHLLSTKEVSFRRASSALHPDAHRDLDAQIKTIVKGKAKKAIDITKLAPLISDRVQDLLKQFGYDYKITAKKKK